MSVAKLNSSALKVLAIRSDCDVGGIDGVDRAGIGDFNNCKDGGEGSMAEDNVDCVNFFFSRRPFVRSSRRIVNSRERYFGE